MPRAMNQVVFEPLQHAHSWTLDVYRKCGGYEAWEKILREKTPREAIIEEVKASGPARPRRRGFPDGRQVELHAAQRAGAEIRGLQLGRERAGHLP